MIFRIDSKGEKGERYINVNHFSHFIYNEMEVSIACIYPGDGNSFTLLWGEEARSLREFLDNCHIAQSRFIDSLKHKSNSNKRD